jgi:hypothetical protein
MTSYPFRLWPSESVTVAFEALRDEMPVWSEILCFCGGFVWRQSRECFGAKQQLEEGVSS